MPLVNKQIDHMDEARMRFVDALTDHCNKLREELRISELLRHSVICSLSQQNERSAAMEAELRASRQEGTMHKPYINDSNRQQALALIEDALKGATKAINNENTENK
jgi:HSP90 family molecular chaperone